jgi:hypothetical protein
MKAAVALASSVLASVAFVAGASESDELPPRDRVEQVLIPLAVSEFDGAFGSHFVVEMWIRNDADSPATIFRLTCGSNPRICSPTASPGGPIPPRSTVLVQPFDNGYMGYKIGEFFWVERTVAPSVFFSLRVRDTSRSSSSAGVEIPTPRESTNPAKMRIQLLNVPVEPGFRHTLRIYTFDYLRDPSISPASRIRVFDLGTDAVLLDEPIGITGFGGEGAAAYTVEPYPNAYASFLDKYDALRGHPKVRVELESNFYKFWAFITVANDVTQEVTVIAP